MSKTMFDDALGDGTLEIQDRHGKLLGRKAVDLDTFSTRDYAEHLRKGFTLNLYRLPLEFDALTVASVAHQVQDKAAIPIHVGNKELRQGNIFDELDKELPPIKVGKPRKPDLVAAWGYTLDMSYSRHFKADIRAQLANHLKKDRSDVNDKHKLSAFEISAPKLPDLFTLFNISSLEIRPNFVKMTFKQFVGLLHYQYTKD